MESYFGLRKIAIEGRKILTNTLAIRSTKNWRAQYLDLAILID